MPETHPVLETNLSPQMLAAISGVAQGKRRSQIADEMGISIHTLKTYLDRAYQRLGARNAPEACAKAANLGILKTGEIKNDTLCYVGGGLDKSTSHRR